MNKCLFNVLFICHRGIFLRFPDCNVPKTATCARITNDGVPFIITEKRGYDFIRALTGMQLRSNEEKIVR